MLDLDPASRRALELDELLDWIAELARTPEGAARIRELRPSVDPAAILRDHATVAEMRRLVDETGPPVPVSLPDVRDSVGALSVAGAHLSAEQLRDLASVCSVASGVGLSLRSLSEAEFPHLADAGGAFADLREQADPVLRSVESDGTLNDSASPELRKIRAGRARVADRLRQRLQGLMRQPGSDSVFREDFVTQRNGRFVVPVRIDTPRPLKGIVHATSSSGATQFVEPLESVESNNELVRLQEREATEQKRLLAVWSDGFRRRLEELSRLSGALAELDTIQARALFGNETGGITPIVDEEGGLELRAMRHPLLDRHLRSSGGNCVPLDLDLAPEDRVLVLSGPNTGGKTVALKTFGLAILMAQSGIPVPARRARLPLERQVRADIGDHQSIQADLSTFSAHIRSVVDFLREAKPPGLFLFDEIGSGTEPAEGAALAQAVLESLLRRGVTTIATTHQAALKSWAFTTDGAVSAALEFDTEALRPTYRILMGAAGISAGLQIAERLGVERSVIQRAEAGLGQDVRRTEAYLNRLHGLTVELERKHVEADAVEARREEQDRRREAEWRQREEQRAAEVKQRLELALARFREESRKGLSKIRDDEERRRAEKATAKLEQRLSRETGKSVGDLLPAREQPGDDWIRPDGLADGHEVLVVSLGREGTVRRIRGTVVDVQMGSVQLAARLDDLRVRAGGRRKRSAAATRRAFAGTLDRAEALPQELKLIGQRVEEALEALDRYLDRASLAGHGEVRIVHGHGTGRLRKAVRQHLRDHPLVRDQRPGRAGEGGDGATIARMKS